MTSYLLSPPAEEPINLAEAKAYLRQDHTLDDDLIQTLISAARIHVEGTTAIAMIAQNWRVVLDGWPTSGIIELPVSPLRALTSINAYDAQGQATSIGLAQVQQETQTERARLILPAAFAENPALREHNGIEIDYVAGYAADATEVSSDLKNAVLALVGHWYTHRDAVVMAGTGAVVPQNFEQMIAKYRKARL